MRDTSTSLLQLLVIFRVFPEQLSRECTQVGSIRTAASKHVYNLFIIIQLFLFFIIIQIAFPGVRCISRKHEHATLFLEVVALFFQRTSYLTVLLFQMLWRIPHYTSPFFYLYVMGSLVISNAAGNITSYLTILLSQMLWRILHPTSLFCYFKCCWEFSGQEHITLTG